MSPSARRREAEGGEFNGAESRPISKTARDSSQFLSRPTSPQEGGNFSTWFRSEKVGDKSRIERGGGGAWNEISSREELERLRYGKNPRRHVSFFKIDASIVNVVTEKNFSFPRKAEESGFRGFIVHPKIKVFVSPLIGTIDIFIQDWEGRRERVRERSLKVD